MTPELFAALNVALAVTVTVGYALYTHFADKRHTRKQNERFAAYRKEQKP
jgi:hypothetical protein